LSINDVKAPANREKVCLFSWWSTDEDPSVDRQEFAAILGFQWSIDNRQSTIARGHDEIH
jgi:hypothetical protein